MTDRTLIYHYPLCPFCRLVRLAFYEKGIPHALLTEIPWERRPAFLEKNPLGTLPMIIEPDESVLSGATTICSYLNETVPLPDLFGETPQGRAEVRRLMEWTNSAFYMDVVKPILDERVYKTLRHKGGPNSNVLRAARQNYQILMPYVVVAKTIFEYLKASSTASAISSLAKSAIAILGVPLASNFSFNNSTASLVWPYTLV